MCSSGLAWDGAGSRGGAGTPREVDCGGVDDKGACTCKHSAKVSLVQM